MGIRMRSREETEIQEKDTGMNSNSNSLISIDVESSSCDCVVIDSPPSYGASSNRFEEGEAMIGVSLRRIIIIDDGDDLDANDEHHGTQCNASEPSEPKVEGECSDSFGSKRFSKLSRCSKSYEPPRNETREDSDSSDCIIIEDPTDELREFCYKSFSRKKSLRLRNQTTHTFLVDSDSELDSDQSVSSSGATKEFPNEFEQQNSCVESNARGDIRTRTELPARENLINPREQLKETEDYKTVIEQEWLSRQREIRIQADEAQRMRKRKKAMMEMERRQKERLEEIRETLKRDEEDLTMKDRLRAELTNDVKMLELTCFDMASLLRGLSIPIPSHPSPSEVHSAYRKALLKFHPDRVAAKKDILLQVEAEEKFKLLCRMKEKFS